MIDQLTASDWLQLAGTVVSLIIFVAVLVRATGKIERNLEKSVSSVDHKVDLVQNTVGPYAEDIAELKRRSSTDRERISKVEAKAQNTQDLVERDIKRLEGRIDAASSR